VSLLLHDEVRILGMAGCLSLDRQFDAGFLQSLRSGCDDMTGRKANAPPAYAHNADGGSDNTPKRANSMMSDEPTGKDATDALGKHLKRAYNKLLQEPVPDKLMELLKRLEDQGTNESRDARPTSSSEEEQS
jgi:Anti-sigma factor NepR